MNRDIQYHPLFYKFPESTVDRILGQYYCELEYDFPGFVDHYEALANLIPKHFTVIDFGCYLATQCWYFRNHRKYIGVDRTGDMERFSMPNSYHYQSSIQEWIRDHLNEVDRNKTFAICNYVGIPQSAYVKVFPNCFCFYPMMDRESNDYDREWIEQYDATLGIRL